MALGSFLLNLFLKEQIKDIIITLHCSAYTSLGRVCTLGKVRTIRGCLGGLALMV
jgi:hypothetical protein